MLKDSREYKEAVRKSCNELFQGLICSPLDWDNWRAAFESGFDAFRNPKEQEKERRKARETFVREQDDSE